MTAPKKDELQRSIMQIIQVGSAIGIFGILFELGTYKEKIDNVIVQVREMKITIDANAQDNSAVHSVLRGEILRAGSGK